MPVPSLKNGGQKWGVRSRWLTAALLALALVNSLACGSESKVDGKGQAFIKQVHEIIQVLSAGLPPLAAAHDGKGIEAKLSQAFQAGSAKRLQVPLSAGVMDDKGFVLAVYSLVHPGYDYVATPDTPENYRSYNLFENVMNNGSIYTDILIFPRGKFFMVGSPLTLGGQTVGVMTFAFDKAELDKRGFTEKELLALDFNQ